jgi:endo-1,4-beta-xylanase
MPKFMFGSAAVRSLSLLVCVLASCNSSQPIEVEGARTTAVQQGLRASFFNDENFGGTAITRIKSNISADWGAGAPNNIRVDHFSARYEGTITPKYSEVYTFIANADDGLRVWVNGVKLIDRWAFHKFTDYSKLKLEANKKYAIKIEYHESTGSALLKLSWQSSSQAKQIIPATAFSTATDGLVEGLSATLSLRALADARGIKLGAEIGKKAFDENATYREILGREFNHAQPGGECLATSTHSNDKPLQLNLNAQGRLEPFDTLLDAAVANKQSLQCFHLVWYEEARWTPFLNTLSVADRRTFISNRIRDMMTRYKGRVESWNVVNEAFTDPPQGQEATVRPRTFSKDGGTTTHVNWLYDLGTGTEYIAEAFKTARAADATAKLFYNDYNIENGTPENEDLSKPSWNKKWDAVLAMVRDFKTRATPVPIDGVGFQAHMYLDTLENMRAVARNLNLHFRQLYAIDPKLEGRVTEFDVNIRYATGSEATRLENQKFYYGEMIKACLSAPNCTGFSTWGISDQYSWLADPQWGGDASAKPLMFDSNMQPKSAYYAVRDALRGI